MDSLILAAAIAITSPSGAITFQLNMDAAHRLVYSIALDARPVVDASPLGIVVDGRNLADGAAIGRVET